MTYDLEHEHLPLAYKLLAAFVVPRPIALVTSLNHDGVVNAAPFSFFNVLGADPPIIGFAPGDRSSGVPKDTALNIRLTGDFVVNLVDEALAEPMNVCSAELPHGVSELEAAGLTTSPSLSVSAPRIAEAPVSLQCRHWGSLEIGANRLVIGLVLRLHARDELIDPESNRVRPGTYHPIGRMHGPDGYCRTRDFFAMPRPD